MFFPEEPELMDHQLDAVEFPPLSICKTAEEWLDAARARLEQLGPKQVIMFARRLGIMNENEPPRPSGPVLVK